MSERNNRDNGLRLVGGKEFQSPGAMTEEALSPGAACSDIWE